MTTLRWLLLGLLGAPVALAPVLRTTAELEQAEDAAVPLPGAPASDPDGGGPADSTPAEDEPESIAVPCVFLKPAARADTRLRIDPPATGGTDGDAGDEPGAALAAVPSRATRREPSRAPDAAARTVAARRRALLRAGRLGLPPPRSPGRA